MDGVNAYNAERSIHPGVPEGYIFSIDLGEHGPCCGRQAWALHNILGVNISHEGCSNTDTSASDRLHLDPQQEQQSRHAI